MPKYLSRLVAILMIPSLLVDPSLPGPFLIFLSPTAEKAWPLQPGGEGDNFGPQALASPAEMSPLNPLADQGIKRQTAVTLGHAALPSSATPSVSKNRGQRMKWIYVATFSVITMLVSAIGLFRTEDVWPAGLLFWGLFVGGPLAGYVVWLLHQSVRKLMRRRDGRTRETEKNSPAAPAADSISEPGVPGSDHTGIKPLPIGATSTWAAKQSLRLTHPRGSVITDDEVYARAVQIAWWWETLVFPSVMLLVRAFVAWYHFIPGYPWTLPMVLYFHWQFVHSHDEGYLHWVNNKLEYVALTDKALRKRVLRDISNDVLASYGVFYGAFLFGQFESILSLPFLFLIGMLGLGAYRHKNILEAGRLTGRPLPVTTDPLGDKSPPSAPDAEKLYAPEKMDLRAGISEQDITKLIVLARRLPHLAGSVAKIVRLYPRVARNPEEHPLWVIRDERNSIVAYLWADLDPFDRSVNIRWIAVDKTHERKRFAEKLLRVAVHEFISNPEIDLISMVDSSGGTLGRIVTLKLPSEEQFVEVQGEPYHFEWIRTAAPLSADKTPATVGKPAAEPAAGKGHSDVLSRRSS